MSGQYRFTKFNPVARRDHKEGAKIIYRLHLLTQRPVLRKNKEHYEKKKKSKHVLYLILGALVGRGRPKIW